MQVFNVFFSINVDACPILLILFMLLAKSQSHTEFLVVREAVSIKDINNAIRMLASFLKEYSKYICSGLFKLFFVFL